MIHHVHISWDGLNLILVSGDNYSYDGDLVAPSGLLNLYDKQPDQLRFIVGRELGRIKTDQLQLRRVTYGLLVILQAIDEKDIPDPARVSLMSYGMGRFLTWCREAEITAGRAGLICCGNPEIAYSALLKLLHGLKEESSWQDPQNPNFDTDKIIERFQSWERQPVLMALRYFHRQSVHAPFLVERLAAFKQYVASGQYEALLNRTMQQDVQIVTTLDGIDLLGLADSSRGVYAYLKCFVKDQQVLTTATAKYGNVAYFKDFKNTLTETSGEPIFVEIWNDGTAYDELLGGFVVYPQVGQGSDQKTSDQFLQTYSVPILWDWKDRSKITRNGVAHVRIRVIPVPQVSNK